MTDIHINYLDEHASLPPTFFADFRRYLAAPAAYYPHFDAWYAKVEREFHDGRRALLLATRGGAPALLTVGHIPPPTGLAILKRTPEEKKICTFWIAEQERRHGLGTCLLSECLVHFDAPPLLTVPEHLRDAFMGMGAPFGLREMQRSAAYYPDILEYFYAVPLLSTQTAASGRKSIWHNKLRSYFSEGSIPLPRPAVSSSCACCAEI